MIPADAIAAAMWQRIEVATAGMPMSKKVRTAIRAALGVDGT